jgi:ParB family transcriptional regulator, chromosome partitioning protein
MSKLLDKTANLQPGAAGERASRESPRSAPGRMFEYTSRINAAEDRAIAAEAQLKDALAQVEQLRAAGSTTVGAHLVDIDTLVEVPGRRRKLSPTEYTELRTNLEETDLVHPIVYRSRGDGKNEIVAGNNRVAIYRDDLKRPRILGIQFNGDAKQAELGATFSNLLAPALPDYEKYRQFIRLQEEFGFSRPDIIKASGLSNSHVARILQFDNLPTEALDAIASRPDRVGGHAAEEFAALAKSGNAEAVVAAIGALVADEKMTQKQALELAKPKPPKATGQSDTRTVNVGKKKLCDLTLRNGVLAVRFNGKQGDEVAKEWTDKIEAFIRSQIERDATGDGKA